MEYKIIYKKNKNRIKFSILQSLKYNLCYLNENFIIILFKIKKERNEVYE